MNQQFPIAEDIDDEQPIVQENQEQLETIKLVFKQNADESWRPTNGWKIVKCDPPEGVSRFWSEYQLIDPTGKKVGEERGSVRDYHCKPGTVLQEYIKVLDEEGLTDHEKSYHIPLVYENESGRYWVAVEVYSHYQRTGRDGKTAFDIKYGPMHFTRGTVVKLNHELEIGSPDNETTGNVEKISIVTVNHIAQNGPSSYLIIGEERHPMKMKSSYPEPGEEAELRDHTFANEPHTIHISFTDRIIHPGDSGFVFEGHKLDRNQSKVMQNFRDTAELHLAFGLREGWNDHEEVVAGGRRKKSEVFVNHSDLIWLMNNVVELGFDVQGRYVDEEKVYDLATSMGFLRRIQVRNHFTGAPMTIGHYLKIGPWKKWMKKNHHRVFMTVKACKKFDEELNKQLYEADDFYD